MRLAQTWKRRCRDAEIGYCALGPVPAERAGAGLAPISRLPDVIAATERYSPASRSAWPSARRGWLAWLCQLGSGAAHGGGGLRHRRRDTPDGLGNMRFAALANCPPHIPFFPAAYYLPDADSRPTLTLALEAADLALAAFAAAASPGRRARPAGAGAGSGQQPNLPHRRAHRRRIPAALCRAGSLSLAPTPGPEQSIGRAFERLAGGPFGTAGTLAMAAFFTGALRAAQAPRTGFSGLMLPVLEDDVLAASAAHRHGGRP